MYKTYTWLCIPLGYKMNFSGHHPHIQFKISQELKKRIIMRFNFIALLLCTFLIQVSAGSFAQKITLRKKNITLDIVFKEITKQTGYDVIWQQEKLKSSHAINVYFNNAPLNIVLDAIFNKEPLTYAIANKTIVIKLREELETQSGFNAIAPGEVRGIVRDEKGELISGASVVAINKSTNGRAVTATGKDGTFRFLKLPAGAYSFTITYVGYAPKTVNGFVRNDQPLMLTIVIRETTTTLDNEIVVTGTGITRKKDSFTGATVTFTGDQLKAIGNNNIIQSLRTMDPSFLLIENNLTGSNPNKLPQIEVRGKTSIPSATLKDQFATDPNQPLFILDGFETTLQTIVDLDMNRVAGVTILKDAASTALYGAKASNGVVVIQTLKPMPGALRITYTNDFRLENPDLSGYNMMNAAEKLEFERLSGRYTTYRGSADSQFYLDQLYNTHLMQVKRGVDSYWLNEPVQTGTSENNSVFVEGGSSEFTYGVGANYKSQQGTMKGSGRDTWSGSINLAYRKSKISVNNVLFVRGYTSKESPYGSFSNFVNANPYFLKDASQRYLEVSRTSNSDSLFVSNPLYNAFLPSKNGSRNLEVQNNLQINYKITPALQLMTGLQLIKGSTTEEIFKSPEDTFFDKVSILKRGTYTNNKSDNFSYQANALLTYGKVFNGKHSITANARAEINNSENRSIAFQADGFPPGSDGNPAFAYSYQENGAPIAYSRVFRTINATLSANYSYDTRYLFDFSYRLDGSTAFGSNKQFSPYFSTGLGWNLQNEAFMKGAKWVNRLKLYANIGITGNQNYGNITSVSVYGYNSNAYYNQFGQGVTLNTLGNPDLDPQKTTQVSGGLDFSLFNNRLTGYINAYNKYTNPLVVAANLPSSTGVFSYPLNIGNLNTRGAEVKMGYSPIYNLEKRVVWNVNITGSMYKSKYNGFGNALSGLNKQQEVNQSLLRFTDGHSPDDIWAAKSLGIDPATGREVFLAKDGQYTFDYNAANLQSVGNTSPTVEGVLSTSLFYKGFNLGIYVRYRFGADIFNTALYNKVENISFSDIAYNQDKRALYDRWQNPGDVARFKAVSQTTTTPMSSRFVQRENSLSGESINLGYTFENNSWLKQLGVRSLNLTAIANDIFRVSSVLSERGIDYPFSKTVSFSLRASF
jgi:TonB-linked SusC/RagA family outer membrane protein